MANYILLLQPSKATHKMLAFSPVTPLASRPAPFCPILCAYCHILHFYLEGSQLPQTVSCLPATSLSQSVEVEVGRRPSLRPSAFPTLYARSRSPPCSPPCLLFIYNIFLFKMKPQATRNYWWPGHIQAVENGKMLTGRLPLFASCPAVTIFFFPFFSFFLLFIPIFCAVPCPSRVFQVPTRDGANKT